MMSYELVHTFPHEMLTSTQNDTCISLYQPTYRTGNEQNIIRFKNLTNEIEQSLKSRLSKQALDERMRPFQEIMNDRDRKSTRLNSSHVSISYAVFCLNKK